MQKSDGKSVRICGDLEVTVNQASMLNYPIPKIEDLLAMPAGSQVGHESVVGSRRVKSLHQQALLPLYGITSKSEFIVTVVV